MAVSSVTVKAMGDLEGRWRVVRDGGLLPPGVTKDVDREGGWTRWFGVRVGAFRQAPGRLVYRGWPIVDEVTRDEAGVWRGRGKLFGRLTFCRFHLEPLG